MRATYEYKTEGLLMTVVGDTFFVNGFALPDDESNKLAAALDPEAFAAAREEGRREVATFAVGLRRAAEADVTASPQHVQGRLAALDLMLEHLGPGATTEVAEPACIYRGALAECHALNCPAHPAAAPLGAGQGTIVFEQADGYGDTLTVTRFAECWSICATPDEEGDAVEPVVVKLTDDGAGRLAAALQREPAAPPPQGEAGAIADDIERMVHAFPDDGRRAAVRALASRIRAIGAPQGEAAGPPDKVTKGLMRAVAQDTARLEALDDAIIAERQAIATERNYDRTGPEARAAAEGMLVRIQRQLRRPEPASPHQGSAPVDTTRPSMAVVSPEGIAAAPAEPAYVPNVGDRVVVTDAGEWPELLGKVCTPISVSDPDDCEPHYQVTRGNILAAWVFAVRPVEPTPTPPGGPTGDPAKVGRSFRASNGRLMCEECCWGDRCDDKSHYQRGLPEGAPGTCPFCKGKVWLPESEGTTPAPGGPST
jgi:hypothetical protein